MTLRTPLGGGVKGFATRAARAAHAGPRVVAHAMAPPAVYTCSLPRKAALRFEARIALMMTAHVYFGWVSQASLAILEPESRDCDSFLKVLTSGENRARLVNSGKVVAQGLVCFHRVEI
jgi:hypothetical protein